MKQRNELQAVTVNYNDCERAVHLLVIRKQSFCTADKLLFITFFSPKTVWNFPTCTYILLKIEVLLEL